LFGRRTFDEQRALISGVSALDTPIPIRYTYARGDWMHSEKKISGYGS
jgi:hypothetical protein